MRRELVVVSRRRRRGSGHVLSWDDKVYIILDIGFVLDMRRNRVVDKIIKDELIFIKYQEWNIFFCFRNILVMIPQRGLVLIPIFLMLWVDWYKQSNTDIRVRIYDSKDEGQAIVQAIVVGGD